MAKKLYEMAVKAGSYTNANGDTKNRYVNIGVVMQSDDGGAFALLEPHVNLAGFNRGDRDSVMVNLMVRLMQVNLHLKTLTRWKMKYLSRRLLCLVMKQKQNLKRLQVV